MSKEKFETGAMMNPRCQKCPKKDICNNKTLYAYLIPKDYFAAANLQQPIQEPIIFTPEMLAEEINKAIINKSFNIGVDIGEGYSRSSMGGK